jgi:hypothetical protein
VERFYILQSRIPLLLTGSESVHVRAAEGAVQVIQELDQTLAALERNVLSLRKEDYASYFHIHAALQQYTTDAQDNRTNHAEGRGCCGGAA